ncbi:MAG: hypothetical protein ABIS51_19095 [Sphingomonas sp.]
MIEHQVESTKPRAALWMRPISGGKSRDALHRVLADLLRSWNRSWHIALSRPDVSLSSARVWKDLFHAAPLPVLLSAARANRGKIDMAGIWCANERFALRDSSRGQIVPGVSSISDAGSANRTLARLAHS